MWNPLSVLSVAAGMKETVSSGALCVLRRELVSSYFGMNVHCVFPGSLFYIILELLRWNTSEEQKPINHSDRQRKYNGLLRLKEINKVVFVFLFLLKEHCEART